MGTNTPNFNLYKPTISPPETGWGTLVNANWDTIDTNMLTATLRGWIAGLTMSRNSGTPNTKLDTTAGQAQDAGLGGMMTLAATITKDLTLAWTVGNNGGGLGNGVTRAATTWYHHFLIKRTDTGVVDAYFDTSVTAANIPSPYTLFRRIGSFKTDGGSNILAFTQDGDYFRWAASVLDANTNNPGTSAVTQTLASVPTGVNVYALLNAILQDAGGATDLFAYVSDLAANDEAPSEAAAPLGQVKAYTGITTNEGFVPLQIRTNTSAQIRYRLSASNANSTIKFSTLGWIDYRGRFA